MTDRTVLEEVRDLDLVEQMLGRIASPDEAAAARRLLGIEREAARLSSAFAPNRPPLEATPNNFPHLEVARASVERYGEWVESFPDDDPTPLAVRERTLRLARVSVARLEAEAE